MIKIGIIGVGRWGLNYFRTLNEFKNATVKYICATKETTLKDALVKVKPKDHVKATTNYMDILKDKEIDAVVIASSSSTHTKFSKEALENDKHVLVEKPIAFHSREVEELVRMSNKRKKVLMAGHLHIYNPAIRKIKDDIKAGLFGKINYIHSIGAGNGPVREDMNALWDFFPHDVSILLYLLEEYPLTVSANGASYIRKDVEDIVTMYIKFSNNIFAVAVASWLYPLKKRDIIIAGEKLYATFEDYAANEKLKYYDNRCSLFEKNNVINNNKYHVPNFKDAKPLTEQLKHFLDCIENNKIPLTDGQEALKVTKVLESAQKSLKKNGLMVKIPKL